MKRVYFSVFIAIVLFFSFGSFEVYANSWKDYTTGTKLLNQGKAKQAIPHLQRAATKDNNASYYRKLAEAYEADHQFQKAADTLYKEAEIHYQIGVKKGELHTYYAVLNMADRLNSELELYVKEQSKPATSYSLAKYEPESGMYIGAFIHADEPMKVYGNQMYEEFNQITGKKHATFFDYLEYGSPFPKNLANRVKNAGAALHIAFEPNKGLQIVKDDAYLRQFARDAAASGIPIFLRFAGEMNGNWVKWNGDPTAYIQAFRTVSRVMKEETNNVAMVWSPGANPKNTINDYYPGDAYVDWVGASIYSVRFFNGNVNQSAAHVNPLDSIDYIYKQYANRKPIMVSEYAATTYSRAGNLDTTNFAITKMKMMYHGAMLKYPRLKAIQWFSLNTLENSHSADRKLNNYSLTENKSLLNAYSKLIQDDYYLSDVVNGSYAKSESTNDYQVISLSNEIIREPSTIFAWTKTYDPNISKVIFKLDGKYIGERTSYPFSLNINPSKMKNGKHTVEAIVFDSKGHKAIEKRVAFYTKSAPSPAKGEIVLYINEPVAYAVEGNTRLLASPIVEKGRTLVPLRFISENLGADVKWNGQNKSITIKRGSDTIVLVQNQQSAQVNGKKVNLDTAPKVVKGTTLLPIRFITEQLQANISYKHSERKIVLSGLDK